MKLLDDFLNRITMYRLVLYSLAILLAAAVLLSMIGRLPYNPLSIFLSTGFLLAVCWVANLIFAKAYQAPANAESFIITALILALIISPAANLNGYLFLFWAGALSMASKYILAVGKKHIFNPAAIAVVITAFAIGQPATWWVGTSVMLPLVLVSGILITKKIRRFDLVISFLAASLISTFSIALVQHANIFTIAQGVFLDSSLFFFAGIMLTEPLTTPPTRILQIYYGILVGFLFAPQIHFGSLYFSPELALVAGNIFVYLVSPKEKLLLTLKKRVSLGKNLYDFIFSLDKKIKFDPGQYLEWTLGDVPLDSRGNRRYFTIASSPTEPQISMGVKFYSPASNFKTKLLSLKPGDTIIASQLAGDFTLPNDKNKKLVLIAGGIGITPFRSMIKYLIDKKEKRDAVLIYSNRTIDEIAYKDVFDQAEESLGIKTIYTLTDHANIPNTWTGLTGYIDEKMIKTAASDYQERTFYISGPNSMITSFKTTLINSGISPGSIHTDYFPGFA